MKKLWLFFFLSIAPYIHATPQTWYFRLDGGDATRCTGHANAPDPGSGSGQACALNHPYWMLQSAAKAWRTDFAAGDTWQFKDVGPYYIGNKTYSGGLGTYWRGLSYFWCNVTGAGPDSDCDFPPMLDNVNIFGANTGHCNQTVGSSPQPTELLNPTVWQGVNGIFYMLNLQGSSGVNVQCIRFTQPASCTAVVLPTGPGHCTAGQDFAATGVMIAYLAGNQGPSNLTMSDISIDNIAGIAMKGSYFNRLSTDTTTFTNLFVIGSGINGIDADGGGCSTNCEDIGHVHYFNTRVYFSGCVWNIPGDTLNATTHTPSNGVNFCADQSGGGSGDQIVLLASNDVDWRCDWCVTNWGTQDGIDGLHLGDDATHNPTITITHSASEGNEGQQYKIGLATSTVVSSTAGTNCRILGDPTAFPMTLNPANYGLNLLTTCRASGDGWFVSLTPGRPVVMEDNSTFGYSTTMYDIGTGGGTLVFRNNISVGYPDPGNSGTYSAGFFWTGTDPFTISGSAIGNNDWFNVRSGSGGGPCPQDSAEINYQCADPMVFNGNVNSINPHLTAASTAVIGLGANPTGISTDLYGSTWNSPPSIGAVEYSGAPSAGGSFVSGGVNITGTVK